MIVLKDGISFKLIPKLTISLGEALSVEILAIILSMSEISLNFSLSSINIFSLSIKLLILSNRSIIINLSVKPLNYLFYKKNITNLVVNRKFLLFLFIKNKIINLSISFY